MFTTDGPRTRECWFIARVNQLKPRYFLYFEIVADITRGVMVEMNQFIMKFGNMFFGTSSMDVMIAPLGPFGLMTCASY